MTGNQTLFLLLRRDLIDGSQSGNEFRSRLQYEGLVEILQGLLARRFNKADAERLAFTFSALIFGYCEFVVITSSDDRTARRRRKDLTQALLALLK